MRKTCIDFPEIESGIVHCRDEMPEGIKSLPHATNVAGINIFFAKMSAKDKLTTT